MDKGFAGSLFFAALAFAPLAIFATPAPAQAQPVVRLDIAPPAPRLEVIPAAPSPRHVWLPGFWNWDARAGQHIWVAGRYEIGRPQMAWVPARWVQKWEYLPGHWASVPAGPAAAVAVQPAPVAQPIYAEPPSPQSVYTPPPPPMDPPPPAGYGEEVEVEVAPPPPQQEVIPVAPSPQHVWIAGFWRWDPIVRRHVWIGGRYELGRPGMRWAPAHWVQHGWRWRYMPGRWR